MDQDAKLNYEDLALVVDAHYVPDGHLKHNLQSPLASFFPASAQHSRSRGGSTATTTSSAAHAATSAAAGLSTHPSAFASPGAHETATTVATTTSPVPTDKSPTTSPLRGSIPDNHPYAYATRSTTAETAGPISPLNLGRTLSSSSATSLGASRQSSNNIKSPLQ